MGDLVQDTLHTRKMKNLQKNLLNFQPHKIPLEILCT
jgi:hypothetical protein